MLYVDMEVNGVPLKVSDLSQLVNSFFKLLFKLHGV